jgi:hypothetical protein
MKTGPEFYPNNAPRGSALWRKRARVQGPLRGCLAILCALASLAAYAADLEGKWTTGSGYVFTFERLGGTFTGSVLETSTGRRFALADIEVDGTDVSFFVVHDAEWDEEVLQNGGKPFRNSARGILGDDELRIHGAREGSNERPYDAVLERLPED